MPYIRNPFRAVCRNSVSVEDQTQGSLRQWAAAYIIHQPIRKNNHRRLDLSLPTPAWFLLASLQGRGTSVWSYEAAVNDGR